MKLFCPKCNTQVLGKDINVSENIGVCPSCHELFRLNEVIDQDLVTVAEKLLRKPPAGILVEQNAEQTIVSVPTRAIYSIFLIPFVVAWSSMPCFAFFQIITGRTQGAGFMLVFLTPFVIAAIAIWTYALFSLLGKVEIVFNKTGQSSIFIGINKIGLRHSVNWKKVKKITRVNHFDFRTHGFNRMRNEIKIEGEKIINIPLNAFNETKSNFLLAVVNYCKYKAK